MGQYFKVVNLDKRELLHPHKFNEGLKLMEFAHEGRTLRGLAVLLSNGNGGNGGDIHSSDSLVGSWAGDRIVVAGDYGDDGRWVEDPKSNLYGVATETFTDISSRVRAMLEAAGEW